jgi:hypothetical protein
MNHRDPHRPGDRPLSRPSTQPPSPRDNALYDGLPAVTNREWGADRSDDASTYGYPGQGGYGDFTHDHQGAFGESQGMHAQSGHGRGGAEFAGHRNGDPVSRGVDVRGTSGYRGRGPQGYTRPDDRIVDDVIGRLTDDEYIDASEILVMVEGGVVTLSGNVPERQMKHRAEDLVADASGVRDIENRIRVDDGSASAGRTGEAVRSGRDQLGSGFSSSARPDRVYDNPPRDSNWPGQ